MPMLTHTKLLISLSTELSEKMTNIHEVLEKLTDIFHIHFEFASNDLLNYHNKMETAISRYLKCQKKYCELSLRSNDDLHQIMFKHSATGNSCSIYLSLFQPQKNELLLLINHLKLLFGAYDIKYIRVLDLCDQANPINLAPSKTAPSINLGIIGTEWYVYLSSARWQTEYSEAVLLSAPALPTLTTKHYVEWFLYADPAVFDPVKARENFVYLGKHRKNPPLFQRKN